MNFTYLQAAGAIAMLLILMPILVYLSAKAAAAGWLRGRYIFERYHQPQQGETKDGSNDQAA